MAKRKKPRQSGGGRKAIFERIRRGTLAFAQVQSNEGGNENVMKIVGSGFPIRNARGLVLTARHVLQPKDGTPAPTHVMMVRRASASNGAVDYEGKSFPLEDALKVTVADNMDLAAVEFNHAFPPDSILTLAKGTVPWAGQHVGASGWPQVTNQLMKQPVQVPSILAGVISAVYPHPDLPSLRIGAYLAQLPVHGGHSGGPVFDIASGKVLGIISGRVKANSGVRVGLTKTVPLVNITVASPKPGQ